MKIAEIRELSRPKNWLSSIQTEEDELTLKMLLNHSVSPLGESMHRLRLHVVILPV